MAKKFRQGIDWYGNDGRCTPAPEALETADCGICGSQMNVRRNVLGATSSIEAMSHKKHLHDSFECPRVRENWHEQIVSLKYEANETASSSIKKILEEEIKGILRANAVR